MNHLLRVAYVALLLAFAGGAAALPDEADSVNVNTAPAEKLAEVLDGVGNSRARAIVDYREQFGAFETEEDLMEVRGIGQHVIDSNREKILFSD